MNVLVLFAHPNPSSFNHSILSRVTRELERRAASVVVRDLYAQRFHATLDATDLQRLAAGQPSQDVQAEQQLIAQADLLVLIYPVWWAGMPGILKGYFDRVFTPGFAYGYVNDVKQLPLQHKRAVIISTTGATREAYSSSGMIDSMNQALHEGIFNFTGIQVVEHLYFSDPHRSTPTNREGMLRKVSEWAAYLPLNRGDRAAG